MEQSAHQFVLVSSWRCKPASAPLSGCVTTSFPNMTRFVLGLPNSKVVTCSSRHVRDPQLYGSIQCTWSGKMHYYVSLGLYLEGNCSNSKFQNVDFEVEGLRDHYTMCCMLLKLPSAGILTFQTYCRIQKWEGKEESKYCRRLWLSSHRGSYRSGARESSWLLLG